MARLKTVVNARVREHQQVRRARPSPATALAGLNIGCRGQTHPLPPRPAPFRGKLVMVRRFGRNIRVPPTSRLLVRERRVGTGGAPPAAAVGGGAGLLQDAR